MITLAVFENIFFPKIAKKMPKTAIEMMWHFTTAQNK
jgi:hypothetical protein